MMALEFRVFSAVNSARSISSGCMARGALTGPTRGFSLVVRADGIAPDSHTSTGNNRMIIVHHLTNSRSQRVLWLLEELGLEYEIKRYERDPDTLRAPPSLREVHPLGKSPVITDGALTLAESGAIIEYLVDRHAGARLAPTPGTPERVRYLYWLHYAEGSAMPLLLLKLVFDRIERARMPFFVRPIAQSIARRGKSSIVEPQIAQHLDFLEAELAKSPWFAGNEFSAADIQMSYPLEAAAARAGLDASRPKLASFLDRIHARPAYQRALERSGGHAVVS
jgi:glutathione S-transferase